MVTSRRCGAILAVCEAIFKGARIPFREMTYVFGRSRGKTAVLAATALLVTFAALFVARSFWVSPDAPVSRMYRTEADLRSLVTAIDTYFADKGVYPPPGEAGIAVALAHLSQTVDYFPDGAPRDGWGRAFVYVPHFSYRAAESRALRDGEFFAPDTYQLYSVGADGLDGVDDVAGRADNITSWDSERSWRRVYRAD